MISQNFVCVCVCAVWGRFHSTEIAFPHARHKQMYRRSVINYIDMAIFSRAVAHVGYKRKNRWIILVDAREREVCLRKKSRCVCVCGSEVRFIGLCTF